MSAWKPGDVAMVTGRWIWNDPHTEARAFRRGSYWVQADQTGGIEDHLVSNVRPLVVIDPEDAEAVERLQAALGDDCWYGTAGYLAAVLREFANPAPPKPDEPLGLGAVVEDDKGCPWVRLWNTLPGRVWTQGLTHQNGALISRAWADVDAVKVLSEGVRP